MERLTRLLAGLLRRSPRLLPAGRRQWAEAVWAEAGEVPAGWPRLLWLSDGLWLIVREVAMARKIVYRLGIAVVAVAVAAAMLASWRGVPHSDSENSVDKLRVAVLALALVGLPWMARRRGVFGPVGDSVTARLVRTGGCTALCALIWVVVQIDRIPRNQTGFIIRGSWGDGGNVGTGQPVDWVTEIVVLALTIGCAVVLKVVRVRRPETEEIVIWMTWGFLGVILIAVVFDQMIITLYAAGIYAMTARRTRLTPAALGLGAGAGVVGSGLVYAVTAVAGVPGHGLILPVAMLGPLAAGFEAARRAPGAGSTEDEQRQARMWQGLAAGVVGGGAVALLTMILTGEVIVLLFIPLVGMLFGALGGTLGAAHPRKPRPARAWSGGLFVLH